MRGWSRTALLCVTLLAFGCSAPDPSPNATSEGTSAPDRAEAPEVPDATEAPDVPPGAPDAPQPPTPEACAAADLAAIDAVIAAQLDAFADDDWEAAFALASVEFRAGTDPDAFAALIEDSFPVIVDDAEHRSVACLVRRPGAAEVRVEVTAADGERADLVYLLVDEDGWAIAGAVPLEASTPPSTEV